MHTHTKAFRRVAAAACAVAEAALDSNVRSTADLAAQAALAARSASKLPPALVSDDAEAAIVHATKRAASDLRTALALVCREPRSRPETIPAILAALAVVAPVSEWRRPAFLKETYRLTGTMAVCGKRPALLNTRV